MLVSSQVACIVGPRFTRCPGEGGRPWVRLDSEHYSLQTDLPAAEAREAIQILERTRVAMLAAMWPAALTRPMPKLQVYVLQDGREFEGLYPRRVRAFFFRSDTEALIVLPGRPGSWQRPFIGFSKASESRLNHELAHYFSTYALLRQPRWLSEGMAEFLETMRVSPDGRTAVVGAPHLAAFRDMYAILAHSRNWKVNERGWWMERVFTWDRSLEANEEDRKVGAMYAGSWLLVHWLYNKHPREFAAYQALLARGVPPDEARREALPELKSPALDGVLFDYLRRRRFPEHTVQVPPIGASFVEQVLDDAEVHAIRAKLAALAAGMAHREPFIGNRWKLSRDELNEALRLDPNSLLALTTKLRAAPEAERPAIARAAVEAHPHESEAWLLLASALGPDPATRNEQEAAYKKALELEPLSAYAATGLAWMYVKQGRIEEALPLARWSVGLMPWSTYALDTYAMALAGSGACAEALQTEQRALELLQEEGDPDMEKVLRERLAQLTDGTLCAKP
nr:tetratricopeptide repeat protein [Pyxidicoccus fallax]